MKRAGIELAAQRCSKEHKAKSLAAQYRRYDAEHGFNADECVNAEDVYEIVFSDGAVCDYCGCDNWKLLGLDRKDNSLGHTRDNCVCSCKDCNCARGDYYDYKTFKKIVKKYKPLKNTFMGSTLYQVKDIDDLLKLKFFENNRPVTSKHVQEIANEVIKNGFFDNNTIEVEQNLMVVISGQHRVSAAIDIYNRTGKLMYLEIIFKDYGGDKERLARIIRGNESNRKNWDITDYVESYRGTSEYESLKALMYRHNIKNYKALMHIMNGINKGSLKNRMDVSDINDAERIIIFMKKAYGENVFDERCASKLLCLKNKIKAVKYLFQGYSPTALNQKAVNGKVNMIVENLRGKGYEVMSLAKHFKKYIDKGILDFYSSHNMKTPNSVDIITMIIDNMPQIEKDLQHDAKAENAKGKSIRRMPFVAE